MGQQLAAEDARALVDGVASPLDSARLRLSDPSLTRGDGAFETIGVWDGRAFRLPDHLDRLDHSLAALALPPAPRQRLQQECDRLLHRVTADAALRICVTATGSRIVTLSPLPPRRGRPTLIPEDAPWIHPRTADAAAGAKSMSYGPHMAARRRAQEAGGDDALLISVPDGHILEGATSAVLFVAGGIVHAPDLALGLVDSISRRTLLDVAHEHHLDVLTGRWPLGALADSDEVIVSTALRAATAAKRVGEWTYGRSHPVTDVLGKGLRARRRRIA